MAKRIVLTAVLLTAVSAAAVFAGGSGQKGAAAQPAAVRDLGGMQIVIHKGGTNYDTATFQPQNDADRRTLEYRTELEKKYNFKIIEKHLTNGDWEAIRDNIMTSIPAGTPDAQIYITQRDWVMTLLSRGLLAPLSDIPGVDFSENNPSGFMQVTKNAFTFGGKTYAFSLKEKTLCNEGKIIYFNKRLFQEAGIDPNTPYDMQKAGTWTWDNFLDLAKKLTKDTNGDRVPDIYGVAGYTGAVLEAYIYSNGANYLTTDASGNFVNATNRPEFIAALNAAKQLETEGVIFTDYGSYYAGMFTSGGMAMWIGADDQIGNEIATMKDDWGWVVPPKGPNASGYKVAIGGDVGIIPASIPAKQQEDIMFAYQLWLTPAPGNDGADAWKTPYRTSFRDSRALDETLTTIFDSKNQVYSLIRMVPALEQGSEIQDGILGKGVVPQQFIESIQQKWNAAIAEFNASLKK